MNPIVLKITFSLSLALFPFTVWSASIWAPGVSFDNGWVDVNKAWDAKDSDMCWAASASNVLEWWQTLYVSAGNILPENAPSGFVSGKEDATVRQYQIFDYFLENWTNAGGKSYNAIPWYLSGGFIADSYYKDGASRLIEGADSAGFFKDLYPNASNLAYVRSGAWAGDFGIYWYTWDKSSTTKYYYSTYEGFSSLLIESFQKQSVVSATVSFSGGAHAITFWGCEYTDDNLVTAVYFTDSDDNMLSLRTVRLSGDDNGIYLDGYLNGKTATISAFNAFSAASIPNIGSIIPEPSTFGLFAGVAALTLVSARRRRK